MPTVRIAQLEPGMILNKAVRDLSGRLLLGAGETVAPQHLRVFRAWGVTEVEVLEAAPAKGAPSPAADLDPALREAAEARARELFEHNDLDHPLVQELFQLVVNRLGIQLQKGGNSHGPR